MNWTQEESHVLESDKGYSVTMLNLSNNKQLVKGYAPQENGQPVRMIYKGDCRDSAVNACEVHYEKTEKLNHG